MLLFREMFILNWFTLSINQQWHSRLTAIELQKHSRITRINGTNPFETNNQIWKDIISRNENFLLKLKTSYWLQNKIIRHSSSELTEDISSWSFPVVTYLIWQSLRCIDIHGRQKSIWLWTAGQYSFRQSKCRRMNFTEGQVSC